MEKNMKILFATAIVFITASFVFCETKPSVGSQLPPGGTTSWEIQEPEEIVTFVLFD